MAGKIAGSRATQTVGKKQNMGIPTASFLVSGISFDTVGPGRFVANPNENSAIKCPRASPLLLEPSTITGTPQISIKRMNETFLKRCFAVFQRISSFPVRGHSIPVVRQNKDVPPPQENIPSCRRPLLGDAHLTTNPLSNRSLVLLRAQGPNEHPATEESGPLHTHHPQENHHRSGRRAQ